MVASTVLYDRVLPYLRRHGYETIRTDQPFGVGSRRTTADAVAYDDRDKPQVLIEVKDALQGLSDPPGPYDAPVQSTFRASLVADAPYFLLTDGNSYHWFRVDYSQGVPQLLEKPPSADSGNMHMTIFNTAEEAERLIWSLVDLFRSRSGLSSYEAAAMVLKLLQAKAADEQQVRAGSGPRFRVLQDEAPEQTFARLENLYSVWSAQGTLSGELSRRIAPRDWSTAVSLLQPYSLSQTGNSVLRPTLARLLQAFSAKTGGQYTTPDTILKLATELIDASEGERVLDPACGTGSFLAAILARWSSDAVNPTSSARVFGVEINSQVADIARLNLLLNGGVPRNIVLADALRLPNQSVAPEISPSSFDVVITNPPMGAAMSDPNIQARFGPILGPSAARQSELLFLFQSLSLLRPFGRLVIVLPDGALTRLGQASVARALFGLASVDAIISLPAGTFAPHSSVRTNILVLTRSTEHDAVPSSDKQVFLAIDETVDQRETTAGWESSDLATILANYRHFRERATLPNSQLGWTVSLGDLLERGFHPTAHEPRYQQLLGLLNELPYPVAKLADLADVLSANAVLAKASYSSQGIAVIGPQQIRDGRIEHGTGRFVTEQEAAGLFQRFTLRPGDLLVAALGAVGQSAIVGQEDTPAISGRHVLLIRLRSSSIEPEFLNLLFTSDAIQTQLAALSSGGTISLVTPASISQLLIPLPPVEEQDRITELLRQAADSYRRASQLEQQAKDLLTTLLRG